MEIGLPARPEPSVLVVEDEADLADLIKHVLERDGTARVAIAGSGSEALRVVEERIPDLIVLDLQLPGLDGLDVCRILRARPRSAQVPIIIVSARAAETDRIAGLDLGADDYLTKPFALGELAARVRALLRRRRRPSDRPSEIYTDRHLTADFGAVAVAVDGRPVRLTRREFELLRYFIQNRNRVLTRDRLLERVWRYGPGTETRSVDVHVGRLRAKLGMAGQQIETVVGMGYRFVTRPTVDPEAS
jgi:DNA-binding response OmpR family regulator